MGRYPDRKDITVERIREVLPQLDEEFRKELALTDKPHMELANSWPHWRKAAAKRLSCSWQLVDKRFRQAGVITYRPAWDRFDVLMPQFLASWHPIRNERPPSDYGARSHDVVWWKTPKTDDHPYDDHEWQAPISWRTDPRNAQGAGNPSCPCCPSGGTKYVVYSNSLKGVAELGEFDEEAKKWKLPKLYATRALEDWDYKKNKKKPEEVAAHDNHKFWFLCPTPGCGSSWEASLNNRLKGRACDQCGVQGSSELEGFIGFDLEWLLGVPVHFWNHETKIGKFSFDFVIPDKKIVIEFDPLYSHHHRVAANTKKRENFAKNYPEWRFIGCREEPLELLCTGDFKYPIGRHESGGDPQVLKKNLMPLLIDALKKKGVLFLEDRLDDYEERGNFAKSDEASKAWQRKKKVNEGRKGDHHATS